MAVKKQGEASARKSAARRTGTAKPDGGATRSGGTGASASKRPDLRTDLRNFAAAMPQGWNHEDWTNFLESLQSRGHDISDREAIGLALEKERLDLALSAVKGAGPQRRQALIARYGNVWSLRNADVAEIASAGGIPRSLAEQIKTAVS
jgi:excinuclease ABC subunit C